MKITTRKLESFPPNSNPYHHNSSDMGEWRGLNLHMMYKNHTSEECPYITLIDTKTGERAQILIEYGDKRDDKWNGYPIKEDAPTNMRYLRFLAVFTLLWIIFGFATDQLILMNYSDMGDLSSMELADMTSVLGLSKAGAYAFIATMIAFFTFRPKRT